MERRRPDYSSQGRDAGRARRAGRDPRQHGHTLVSGDWARAGRRGSRTAARNSISLRDARDFLKQQDVLVEGLSVDEAPQAYKDIERVMRLQVEAGLIAPVARM